jgi:hypothetical protein
MRSIKNDLIIFSRIINARWPLSFRRVIGLFSLVHFLSYFKDYFTIVQDEKYLTQEVNDLLVDDLIITFFDLGQTLPFFRIEFIIYSVTILYLVSLIFMVLHKLPRTSSIIATLTHITLVYSISMFTYGVDYFTSMALFYCCVIPTNTSTSRLFLVPMQLHFIYLYFVSGFSKIIGFPWRDGQSIYRALTLHNNLGWINVSDLHPLAWMFPIIGWIVILTELCYPLVAIKRLTRVWIFLAVSMHLGIAIGLGLVYFATIMIIFNLFAFIIPYYNNSSNVSFSWKSIISSSWPNSKNLK